MRKNQTYMPTPEDTRKTEIDALAIRRKKNIGKRVQLKTLKEKFPEKYGQKSKGSSFSERATESRQSQEISGRNK